jgi:hypothetical protein
VQPCDGSGEWCDKAHGKDHEPHFVVDWAGVTETRVCKRCGHENTSSD